MVSNIVQAAQAVLASSGSSGWAIDVLFVPCPLCGNLSKFLFFIASSLIIKFVGTSATQQITDALAPWPLIPDEYSYRRPLSANNTIATIW